MGQTERERVQPLTTGWSSSRDRRLRTPTSPPLPPRRTVRPTYPCVLCVRVCTKLDAPFVVERIGRVLETSFGNKFWKLVLETSFGNKFWKQVLEISFGNNSYRGAVVETKEKQ